MPQSYETGQMTDGEIRQAFARCFATREGRIALSFLNRITLGRYLGPESTADELRHLEGQRHLVSYINALAGYHNN